MNIRLVSRPWFFSNAGPAAALLGVVLLAMLRLQGAAPQSVGPEQAWVATWTAAPAAQQNKAAEFGGAGRTVRQTVHLSLGGSAIRLTLSNEFGREPLEIDAVATGLASESGSAMKAVTFGGQTRVVIPPGALILSDPIAISAPALSSLVVDLYVPAQAISILTCHPDSQQDSSVAEGDQVGHATLSASKSMRHWYFLKEVDVAAPRDSAAIVAFGDSITDGHKSTPNTSHRWPDLLASRLQANPATRHLAVVNQGISGNRLLRDLGGPAALARFDRDVLALPGVRYLILLEGINDIGHVERPAFPGDTVTAAELEFAVSQLIERAHRHGIEVLGATLTPYPGTGPAAARMVALQHEFNDRLRSNQELDGLIDFNAATRDPQHPDSFNPAYDSGDHLHPGDAGYRAMAESIDLHMFAGKK
jgi:lysophospholipase L1-like esterase